MSKETTTMKVCDSVFTIYFLHPTFSKIFLHFLCYFCVLLLVYTILLLVILVKFIAGVVLSEKIGLKSVIFPRDTFENFPVSGIMRWAYGTGCVGVVNRPDHFAPALHTRIVLMV